MASPKLQTFFLYDATTGAPAEGQTLSFLTYKGHDGADLVAPTITEIGGGAYGFEPEFTPGQGIAYCIDCGAGVVPAKVAGYVRPEDYNVDALTAEVLANLAALAELDLSEVATKLDRVLDHFEGRWEIKVAGNDANKMILYRRDGTVLVKFSLRDKNGFPTVTNPYTRIPE